MAWRVCEYDDMVCNGQEGNTVFHMAVQFERTEVVRLLCELKAPFSYNVHGRSPLHHCMFFCTDVTIPRLLLEQKADVNATDHEGFTPLHVSGDILW